MTVVLSHVKRQAASAFMIFKRITKWKMVLFINLLWKGLTQEINARSPCDGLLALALRQREWCPLPLQTKGQSSKRQLCQIFYGGNFYPCQLVWFQSFVFNLSTDAAPLSWYLSMAEEDWGSVFRPLCIKLQCWPLVYVCANFRQHTLISSANLAPRSHSVLHWESVRGSG